MVGGMHEQGRRGLLFAQQAVVHRKKGMCLTGPRGHVDHYPTRESWLPGVPRTQQVALNVVRSAPSDPCWQALRAVEVVDHRIITSR